MRSAYMLLLALQLLFSRSSLYEPPAEALLFSYLRRQLQHHRHRPHYSRQRRSGRDDSEDDLSDSDVNRRRVSFLHHNRRERRSTIPC